MNCNGPLNRKGVGAVRLITSYKSAADLRASKRVGVQVIAPRGNTGRTDLPAISSLRTFADAPSGTSFYRCANRAARACGLRRDGIARCRHGQAIAAEVFSIMPAAPVVKAAPRKPPRRPIRPASHRHGGRVPYPRRRCKLFNPAGCASPPTGMRSSRIFRKEEP